ncbi:hypothetical protein [Streptomyces atratus]|uniref:hypothetical protein n=1 Tax=Streptomyces atratus TaxID=1893 RepID=UPI003254DC63
MPLLDDLGEDDCFEGTVGDRARWALTRMGDQRALPELVERLYAPYRDQYSRGYCVGDPHLPEVRRYWPHCEHTRRSSCPRCGNCSATMVRAAR